MYDLITEYWLLFFLGLVAACITWVIREYYKNKAELIENEDKEEHEKIANELLKKFDESVIPMADNLKQINDKMDSVETKLAGFEQRFDEIDEKIETNTAGTLRIYKTIFYQECRELLEKGHAITFEEYTKCMKDHKIYNEMGGNDIGDKLCEQVEEKYQFQNK